MDMIWTLNVIKKNLIISREISRLAQQFNVSFDVAKVIYNDGNYGISVEDAEVIVKISTVNRIPISYITDIMNRTGLPPEQFNTHYIGDLFNENFMTDEVKKIGEPNYYYGQIYYLSQKYNFSLYEAKRLVDIKIERYAKMHNVSKEEATLVAGYSYDKKEAKKIMEAIKYYEENNITPNNNTLLKVHDYLLICPKFYRKEVHGIIIVSESPEKLKKMEKAVNKMFAKGQPQFLKTLESESNKRDLIVTDWYSNDKSAFYNHNGELINIPIDRYNDIDYLTETLYHEVTHFLDYMGNGYISNSFTLFKDVFESLDENVFNSMFESLDNENVNESLMKIVLGFMKDKDAHLKVRAMQMALSRRKELSEKYISDEKLQKKWRDEIDNDRKHLWDSKEDRDLYFEQKLYYEKTKYYILYSALSDIYDALAKGSFYDTFLLPGHGKKYYANNGSDLREFIANLGAIVNMGGEDLLVHEFGEEIANEMVYLVETVVAMKAPPERTSTVVYDGLDDSSLIPLDEEVQVDRPSEETVVLYDGLQQGETTPSEEEKVELNPEGIVYPVMPNYETLIEEYGSKEEITTDDRQLEIEEMIEDEPIEELSVEEKTESSLESDEDKELSEMLNDQPTINTNNKKTM